SRVSVTRRTLPLRSRTRVEKSIPSNSGGFGKASQTPASTIARKIALRVHRLRTYVFTFRNPVSGLRNYLVTLIFPPNPRAFTLRSYIDSAKTGGTINCPRLHDLIW